MRRKTLLAGLITAVVALAGGCGGDDNEPRASSVPAVSTPAADAGGTGSGPAGPAASSAGAATTGPNGAAGNGAPGGTNGRAEGGANDAAGSGADGATGDGPRAAVDNPPGRITCAMLAEAIRRGSFMDAGVVGRIVAAAGTADAPVVDAADRLKTAYDAALAASGKPSEPDAIAAVAAAASDMSGVCADSGLRTVG